MARYLIDANLPKYISFWHNDDCVFVVDLGKAVSDPSIWDYALKHELMIVTKVADFTDRVLLSAAGPRVIQFRIGNMRLREFHRFLDRIWDSLRKLSEQYRLVLVHEDRIECVS